jgi:hypothetical protein
MKYLAILVVGLVLASCGKKVAYTNQLRDEFGLENEKAIKKVQFFTSQTIILTRSRESGNTGTADDGALVTSSNRVEDRITIPPQTKGIFEKFESTGEIVVRFEVGVGNTITFGLRQQSATGKYYLIAKWDTNKGGELTYGNQPYTVLSSAGNAYLMVKIKNLQKTKRKDRVVKGMKV